MTDRKELLDHEVEQEEWIKLVCYARSSKLTMKASGYTY